MPDVKLLVISHSAVISGYRQRFSEVFRQSGAEITLLVPRQWRQFNTVVELGATTVGDFRIIPRQPLSWGLRHHGLKNAAHIYPGLSQLIKRLRPDIVEVWAEPFAAVTAQAVRAAGGINPPSRIIFFSAQNIRRDYPPPFSCLERFTFRHADFAFPINIETDQILREKGWRKGSAVLPMGIDPAHFRELDSSRLRRQLGLEHFTIGFVGKFDRQKGILDLIQAARQLDGDFNLLLIGQGPLKSRILGLSGELGIRKAVRIIDPIVYDELPAYLNSMHVLVLPSITLPGLKEQFGRVLVEAMSCGVPVIGSSSGEIPRVIGESGLVFEEGNTTDLAGKINLLLDNPTRARQLGTRGRERARDKFSWKVIARRQIEAYRDLGVHC